MTPLGIVLLIGLGYLFLKVGQTARPSEVVPGVTGAALFTYEKPTGSTDLAGAKTWDARMSETRYTDRETPGGNLQRWLVDGEQPYETSFSVVRVDNDGSVTLVFPDGRRQTYASDGAPMGTLSLPGEAGVWG